MSSEDRPSETDSPADTHTDPAEDERMPNTTFNALIGSLVTVATVFFVPFSPVVGGGVAGFLEGGDTDSGLKVGTLSGLIAMIPLLLIVPLALFFIPVIGPRGAAGVLLLAAVAVVFIGAYTVGCSALGGALGSYLKREI